MSERVETGEQAGHPREKENDREASSTDQRKGADDRGDREDSGGRKKSPLKRPAVIISLAAVLCVLIAVGIVYWLYARHYVSTDDAYVDGNVVQISPQVPALVAALHIDDNQLVHRGDLLVELDRTDYQVALEQAQAQLLAAQGRLAQAEAQLDSAKAAVARASAEVEAAQVALDNATRDLNRYEAVDERARSRQQLDNANAAQKTAQAQLEQARAGKTSADTGVATAAASIKAAQGEVRTSEANVNRAQVNLGYCRIVAPCDGRVTQRTVQAGNFAATGQVLFMLVEPDVWVTANFKETQLAHMRPGQPVTIKVDAFPGEKFQGHVDSIQAGSGSRFAVLPAENATGNFVKIVQRVPVKILFDHGSNTNQFEMLSPGLSVIPKVRVR